MPGAPWEQCEWRSLSSGAASVSGAASLSGIVGRSLSSGAASVSCLFFFILLCNYFLLCQTSKYVISVNDRHIMVHKNKPTLLLCDC